MSRGKVPSLHVDCDCCSHEPSPPWVPPPVFYGPRTLKEFLRVKMLWASVDTNSPFDVEEYNFNSVFEFFARLDTIASFAREAP